LGTFEEKSAVLDLFPELNAHIGKINKFYVKPFYFKHCARNSEVRRSYSRHLNSVVQIFGYTVN
jgi:hypothetical protein